jgi:hypothetical protein
MGVKRCPEDLGSVGVGDRETANGVEHQQNTAHLVWVVTASKKVIDTSEAALDADVGPCQAVLENYLASGLSRSMVFASGDGAMDRTHV